MHLPFISKVNALHNTRLQFKKCINESGNVEILFTVHYIDLIHNLFYLVPRKNLCYLVEVQYS
jgi:hypothetical protein